MGATQADCVHIVHGELEANIISDLNELDHRESAISTEFPYLLRLLSFDNSFQDGQQDISILIPCFFGGRLARVLLRVSIMSGNQMKRRISVVARATELVRRSIVLT